MTQRCNHSPYNTKNRGDPSVWKQILDLEVGINFLFLEVVVIRVEATIFIVVIVKHHFNRCGPKPGKFTQFWTNYIPYEDF